jgi:hypothetical protein
VEDAALFRRLHRALVEQILPQGVVEQGLAHRIAHNLWRLQRAAKVDAAVSGLAVEAVVPQREAVHHWIEQINQAWQIRSKEEKDPRLRREQEVAGRLHPQQPWYRFIRDGLGYLDRRRQREMMADGAAITAMLTMLDDLATRLRERPESFMGRDAEQLAWLLGDEAAQYPLDDPDTFPAGMDPPIPTSHLVGLALRAARGSVDEAEQMQLNSMVICRARTLGQLRHVCEHPYVSEQDQMARLAALLPGEETLQRLTRYESHAERSLYRCLELLAKLRGASVESLSALVTRRPAERTEMAFQAERTRWTPPVLP